MQLDITGHHVEVTEPLREYVVSKLDKISRHFDLVSDVHCILTVEKLRHKAEATVSLNGAKLYADATEEDMYAAIDSLADKLERRVRKHKEKLVDHHARDSVKRTYG
jgi:putative sigma-54 modulation protein